TGPAVAGAAGQDNPSDLGSLQAQRDAVRRQRAAKASQVNALKATDQQVTGALAALDANVNSQQSAVEEAERGVKQAQADQSNAEAAQQKAMKELEQLKGELKSSAVDAYVSMGSSSGMSALGAGTINDTVNRRTLLSVQANDNIDLIERYRSVQEDLEIQRAAATAAAKRAEARKSQAKQRMDALNAAYAKQRAFAAQVDARVNAALAEAESLAAVDSKLSGSISARQSAIARQVAAQQAAAAARNASRRQAGLPVASTGGGGNDNSPPAGPPPDIVGSGGIVSVGGIRVSASIAGQLQALLSAARAAGINFSGGGYRDSSAQVALRRAHCGSSSYAVYQAPASSCRPPTARPGASMHERGLAIDFTQGGRTLTRGSAGFQWLRANAGRFGFANLPSEPWHWSTNGN
ncbi:MAG: D-alanyl-D-alanine carboxypeptidase family protein, partial [Actinomycetes bacterium]